MPLPFTITLSSAQVHQHAADCVSGRESSAADCGLKTFEEIKRDSVCFLLLMAGLLPE